MYDNPYAAKALSAKRKMVQTHVTGGSADAMTTWEPKPLPFFVPKTKATTAFEIDTSTGHVLLEAEKHDDHTMAVHWEGLDDHAAYSLLCFEPHDAEKPHSVVDVTGLSEGGMGQISVNVVLPSDGARFLVGSQLVSNDKVQTFSFRLLERQRKMVSGKLVEADPGMKKPNVVGASDVVTFGKTAKPHLRDHSSFSRSQQPHRKPHKGPGGMLHFEDTLHIVNQEADYPKMRQVNDPKIIGRGTVEIVWGPENAHLDKYQAALKEKQKALLRRCQGMPDHRRAHHLEEDRKETQRLLREKAEREQAEMLAEGAAKSAKEGGEDYQAWSAEVAAAEAEAGGHESKAARRERLRELGLAMSDDEDDDVLGHGTMKGPWQAPSMFKAIQHRNKRIFAGGEADLVGTTAEQMGREMGVGILLYFKLLQYLLVYFAIASLIAAATVMFNASGSGIDAQSDASGFAFTTVGNVKDTLAELGQTPPPLSALGITIDRAKFRELLPWVDVFYSLLFLLGIARFRVLINQCVRLDDESKVSAADYAVLVRGLPTHATEESVRQHFSSRYNLTQQPHVYPMYLGCCGKRRSKGLGDFHTNPKVAIKMLQKAQDRTAYAPVTDMGHGHAHEAHRAKEKAEAARQQARARAKAAAAVAAGDADVVPDVDRRGFTRRRSIYDDNDATTQLSGVVQAPDPEYVGSWVAEVSIAHPHGDRIRAYLANVELLTRIKAAEQEVRKYSPDTELEAGPDEMRRERATARLTRLQRKLAALNLRIQAALAKLEGRHEVSVKSKAEGAGGGKGKDGQIKAMPGGAEAAPAQIDKSSHCVCAFVLFDSEEAAKACLDDYRTSESFLGARYQPGGLRYTDAKSQVLARGKKKKKKISAAKEIKRKMRGGLPPMDLWTGDIPGYHRLEVTEAPEPEDVIWENLEESDRSLQLRRGFVNLVTFILLLISFFLMIGIYGARNRLEAVSKPMSTVMCSITLRSAAAGGYDDASKAAANARAAVGQIKPTLNEVQREQEMAATNTFGLVRGDRAQDAWCRKKLGISDLIWLGYGGVTPMPQSWSPSASHVPALSLPASWNLTNAALPSRTGAPECWHQCVPPAVRESDAEDAAAAAGVAGAGPRAGALLAAAAPVAGVCSTAVMAAAQSIPALISAEARATLDSSATTCCSLGCQVVEWTAQPEVPAAIAPTVIPSVKRPTMLNFSGVIRPNATEAAAYANYSTALAQDAALVAASEANRTAWIALAALHPIPAPKCLSYSSSLRSRCYCKGLVGKAVQDKKDVQGVADTEPMCKALVENHVSKSRLAMLSVLAIVTINAVMDIVLDAITQMERHHSNSVTAASLIMKMTVAKFINTGLVIAVANAKLPSAVIAVAPWYEQYNGAHEDLTAAWYTTVGGSVCLTMAINVIAPHGMPLVTLAATTLRRWWTLSRWGSGARNQYHLNELLDGQVYKLHEQYSVVLNTVFVTLLFCGGVPLLLPLAVLAILLMYVMEKSLLLRMYNRPHFDESLGVVAVNMLPIALALHAFASVMFYTADDVLPPPASEQSSDSWRAGNDGMSARMLKPHVFPLTMLFAGLVGTFTLKRTLAPVLFSILYKLRACLNLFTLNTFSCLKEKRAELSEAPISCFTQDYEQTFYVANEEGLYEPPRQLTLKEQEDGWIWNRNDGDMCWNLHRVYSKRTYVHGELKSAGEYMRTWEAMPTQSSYRIMANHKYLAALGLSEYSAEGFAELEAEAEEHAKSSKWSKIRTSMKVVRKNKVVPGEGIPTEAEGGYSVDDAEKVASAWNTVSTGGGGGAGLKSAKTAEQDISGKLARRASVQTKGKKDGTANKLRKA